MIDLGTLGGTIGGAQVANNRGQVIGGSNLAGDVISHAFFWDRGIMKDLGTLGGDNVTAYWLNDAGEVVGFADTSVPGIYHAFLWKHGTMRDLGQVGSDPCSKARAINSHEQIVGSGSDCVHPLHAFLSEDGGPLVDLNTLVSDGPDFKVLIAYNINERGEIAGTGVPAGCDLSRRLWARLPADPVRRRTTAANAATTPWLKHRIRTPLRRHQSFLKTSSPGPKSTAASSRFLEQRIQPVQPRSRPANCTARIAPTPAATNEAWVGTRPNSRLFRQHTLRNGGDMRKFGAVSIASFIFVLCFVTPIFSLAQTSDDAV